jgi:cysteine-rich repeat protein
LCLSDFTNAQLAGTVPVTAGTTYYFYIVDTTSGANPLSNPLLVDISETAQICGDGFIIGSEGCDDANVADGDGCSSTCQIEGGYSCAGEPSVCSNTVNPDTCASPAILTGGTNVVAWTATGLEYITAAPACGSGYAPTGPDLVMQYTAPFTGEIDFSIVKPTSTRWHLLVNDDTCGTISPELLCLSDFTNPELGGVLPIIAGTTYYFYIVDTTSGANPLSNPLQVDIIETPAICGDGALIGGEDCDDGNLVNGDGCSDTCLVEPGYLCTGSPSVCMLESGDTCAVPIALTTGLNTVNWVAAGTDYITAAPACGSGYAPNGPDVVMQFTATVNGEVDFSIDKPTSTRWHLLINDDACGSLATTLVCLSDFTNPALTGVFDVVAGNTYTFYIVDTTSGANPLSNPLLVTVNETPQVCGDGLIMGAEECDDSNIVDADGCSSTCTIEAGYVCNGEPSVCLIPPCAPGTNGMVGDTVTLMATDLPTALAEGYMGVDDVAGGFIYIGSTSALHRVPKLGGASENVTTLAGLGTANLGYSMLIDGLDIYTLEAKTTGTTGYVWRITADGGMTWGLTDYATLPAAPNDTPQGITVDSGIIYFITNEVTTSTATQIFSVPAGGVPPVAAVLETSFTGEGRCAGLAMDDDFFYTACGTGERLIRVDRSTGAVTLLTTAFNLDLNSAGVHAHDFDLDGAADYLYVKGGVKEIGFVCDPGGALPYAGVLATYGSTTSTTSQGLAFDPSTLTLYAFDDATEEIVIVE